METTTYNEQEEKHIRDEISRLLQTPTNIDVSDLVSLPVDALADIINGSNIHCGIIKKKEAGFGFVDDIFVCPRLASQFSGGDSVVVMWDTGPRGPRAQKIVKSSTYVEWHADELVSARRSRVEEHNRRYADNLKDKMRFWNSMKERTLQTGYQLIEFTATITRTTYGGSGVDTMTLGETVTPSEARAMFKALGLLHESNEPGSFEHGRDDITVAGNTITNKWVGPWTD